MSGEIVVLASQSASRKAMLTAAGVPFVARPAHVDERAIEAAMDGDSADDIASALAVAKALAGSAADPGALVLGSDSLVEVEGRRFDKPASREDAAAHLQFFSGKIMRLHSAAALAQGGVIRWQGHSVTSLHVIEMSDAFIEDYLNHEWPAVAGCVGVFRFEARGVQLFERVEGDHFTVLGMPLLGVLGALRELGVLAT
ncbi:MAG: nucleoside triphosphate pyrophosphatase [Novosphingobium sp.]